MKFLILASVLAVGFCDMMVGGKTDQDISDPKIAKEYLDMTFREFGFDQSEANEDVQLVKVQTQVVNGENIYITLRVDNQICEIDIYEQLWRNVHKVDRNTCVITKRQLLGGMPGGWTDVKNRSDTYVQKALVMVLDRVNQGGNNMYRLVERNIISLKQQVVSGMKYNITMTVGPSTCRNDQAHSHLTATRCPYDTNSMMKPVTVTATVLSKPWENFMQLLTFNGQKVSVDDGDGKDTVLSDDNHDSVGTGSVEPVKAVQVDKQKDLKKPLLGRDNHDYQIHGYQNMMGGINMGRHMMGGHKMGPGMMNDYNNMGPGMMEDYKNMGPDMMNYYKNMGPNMMNKYPIMGPGMMNDYKNMGPGMMNDYKNMGPDMMNDYKNMGPDMMGDYKNDMMPVNNDKPLLGGDTHDYEPHGKPLIGGDTHDYEPHGKPLIGGGTHDYEPHGATKGTGDRFECNQEKFLDFQLKYNKKYSAGKETTKRYKIFCDNLRKARKLQETEKGTATYGATKFADLTEAEFKQYLGKPWHKVKNYNTEMKRADIPKGQFPASFDWREHGAVTAVKNQGSCGSCWAFSTTGNIEGQWAIKKQKLISLSEQELVDCDKLDDGCEGGLPSNAYKEIERLGGLETETEYSYKGEDEKCEFVKKDVKVYINSSVTISSNETEIAAWLAANGPISIGINAFAMQFYFGGISHPWKIFCNPKELDHGVLIVGYGVQGSEPYWVIKNSWGPDWGEKGYYLVYRGAGVCGLNTMCTSSVVN